MRPAIGLSDFEAEPQRYDTSRSDQSAVIVIFQAGQEVRLRGENVEQNGDPLRAVFLSGRDYRSHRLGSERLQEAISVRVTGTFETSVFLDKGTIDGRRGW